jgi:hypothetical protein
LYFWFENKPSGNPDSTYFIISEATAFICKSTKHKDLAYKESPINTKTFFTKNLSGFKPFDRYVLRELKMFEIKKIFFFLCLVICLQILDSGAQIL